MKKIVFAISVVLSALISYSAFSQTSNALLKEVYDAEHDETYKVGEYTDFSLLKSEPGFEAIDDESALRQIMANTTQLEILSGLLQDVQVVIVVGTWCGDSQAYIPEMLNAFKLLDVSSDHVRLYALDRNKKGLNREEEQYGVEYVPTVVFYKNGIEVGRFVESPQESVMDDFITILSGN